MPEVITDEVKCPWCGAEPGEPCTEPSSNPPYVQRVPWGRGHLARTKPLGSDSDPPPTSRKDHRHERFGSPLRHQRRG